MAASCAAVAAEAAASNLDYLAFLTVLCGQEVAQREQTQAARRSCRHSSRRQRWMSLTPIPAPSVKQAAVLGLATGGFVRAHELAGAGWAGLGKTNCCVGGASAAHRGTACVSGRRRRW